MKVNVNLINKNWNKNKLSLLGRIWGFAGKEHALQRANDINAWAKELKNLNGFYALVNQAEERLFAAVDHIRSRPLFYGQTEKEFYLSDSAEWVRQQVNDRIMDEEAKAEFQLAGYVTGRDTLYKKVKQLQAGECLAFTEGRLQLNRFYRLQHIEPAKYDEQQLKAEFNNVTEKSVQHLIEYANGRQIVIPLSGGYDSRLVATFLKKSNYKNIIAFCYGVKGNKESLISKKVADSLQIKWHFIEYTEQLWKETWQTEGRKSYTGFGSNCCSLPHIQDWLAVKILANTKLLEKDCVFVPGHSGDFISGGDSSYYVSDRLEESFDVDDVCESLFSRKHWLAPLSITSIKKEEWLEKIKFNLESNVVDTAFDFAEAFEKWIWQEEQAKYIFNSVRVYEFFHYDWWTPLWDREFITFFENLPLRLRNHQWYKEFVENKYLEISSHGSGINLGNASDLGLLHKFAKYKIFDYLRVRGLLSKLYGFFVKPKSQLAFEGMYSVSELKELSKLKFNLNGVAAYFFLKEEAFRKK